MKRLNKKGFTLVELLAVIVVLGIIMVIATQQVGKAMNNSRANAFVESYQMIAKQVNTYLASDEDPVCADATACAKAYNLSSDYTLTVAVSTDDGHTSQYKITLQPTTGGKFANLNLDKYGKYIDTDTSKCSSSKIGSGANTCGAIIGDDKTQGIIGYINY